MTSDQMHYATYGRSRYRRKNNVNTKATSYEKSARRPRLAKQSSSDNIEKKNINRKGEHTQTRIQLQNLFSLMANKLQSARDLNPVRVQ